MQISLQRTWLWVMGVGLVLLWMAELGEPDVPRGLAWLDLIAAVISFIGAVVTRPEWTRAKRAAGTIGLGLGVLALWVIGLANGSTPWVAWWNFSFGVVYLVVGILSGIDQSRKISQQPTLTLRRSA